MKNKYSYIGLSAVILIFGIIFIPRIVQRLAGGTVVENTRMSNSDNNFEHKNEVGFGVMTTIGKVPEFSFMNQRNDTISNAYYNDKVYVVEFFFSTCPSICPIMTDNLLKVQEAFKDEDQFGIASFSIDPTYDTPEVLQEYATDYGATHPHWNYLTGNKANVLKLSNEGFRIYAAENAEVDGGFEHQGLFALIDQEGNIRSRIDENGNPVIYYDGLTPEGIAMIIEDIKKLLKE